MKKNKNNKRNNKNHCSCKAVSMKKGKKKKFLRGFIKKHSKQIFKYSIKALEVVKIVADLYFKFKGIE